MSDLVAFLRARLDEDERIARAVRDGTPWRYNPAKYWRGPVPGSGEEAVFTGPAGAGATCICGTGDADHPEAMARAEHIARHDPVRVLADVAAKRAILEIHGQAHRCPDHLAHDVGPCRTLLLLAQPYVAHPGFDTAWS